MKKENTEYKVNDRGADMENGLNLIWTKEGAVKGQRSYICYTPEFVLPYCQLLLKTHGSWRYRAVVYRRTLLLAILHLVMNN